VAIINQKKCTQCGVCILQCPKKIMKRIPATAKYYIACSSLEKGKDVRAVCKRGCIGCGLCAKNCPSEAITIKNNLPTIDYSKCTNCGLCASKCPAKCIVEVGKD
ncbi:MAG: 4Fe-4S binding protein, partial [Clostridia bacterium]|nr:4Fe-4S binding protein [Clostridia bacterium]